MNIVLQRRELTAGTDSPGHRNKFLVYTKSSSKAWPSPNIAAWFGTADLLLNMRARAAQQRMRSPVRAVVYSERPNDGDHIVWYQRSLTTRSLSWFAPESHRDPFHFS